ncbi:hypothetical protein OGAPHI_003116 [Ogataea philodendri]|uniref:separase n=1 Tax=Ogataea philodendri TaxID=1378263 RepID=A0A9P8P9X1_9ASCO|nr:uncharacterized protein OGAPHI_003116 [Ogataea philodendri]KAH3667467.1 hypothetical protein OGAPHI_003116 [Ogataea philodendri]
MSSGPEDLGEVLSAYLASNLMARDLPHSPTKQRAALQIREPNLPPSLCDPINKALAFINTTIAETRQNGYVRLDKSTVKTIALCLQTIASLDECLHIRRTIEICKLYLDHKMVVEAYSQLTEFYSSKRGLDSVHLDEMLKGVKSETLSPSMNAELILIALELSLMVRIQNREQSPSFKTIIEYTPFEFVSSLDRHQKKKLQSILSELCTLEHGIWSLLLRYHSLLFTDQLDLEFALNTIAEYQMLSDENVYAATAQSFYNVCVRWKLNQKSFGPLNFLVEKYRESQPKTDTLDWASLVPKSVVPVSNFEDYITYLLTTTKIVEGNTPEALLKALKLSSTPLNNDPMFAAESCRLLKRLDLESPADQSVVLDILQFCKKTYPCLNFFDMVTIKIKDMDPIKQFSFGYQALNTMADSLKNQCQPKRLRNFSNLLFHFGGKLLTKDVDSSVVCWKKALDIEDSVAEESSDQFDQLKIKCERMVNMLIESKNHERSFEFILQAFQSFEQLYGAVDVNEYQQKIADTFGVMFKLIVKMISRLDCQFSIKYFGVQDKTKAFCAIELIKLLTSVKPSKRDQISKFIVETKNELQDNGLFLYFLSSISFIIEFGLALKSIQALRFESNSVMSEYHDIIVAHIYLLQCCTQMEESFLMKSLAAVLSWAKVERPKISKYEFEVLLMVSRVLQFSGLMDYASYVLDLSLQTCQFGELEAEVRLELASLNLALGLPQEALDGLPKTQPDEIMSVVQLTTLRAQCYATMKDHRSQQECTRLLEYFKDSRLQVGKQASKLNVSKLLMLAANVSVVVSLHHSQSNKIEAVLNLKQSVRVLQSVMKNFLVTDGTSMEIDLCHKMVLKLQFVSELVRSYGLLADMMLEIGLCKDFEYYTTELEKVLTHQSSMVLKTGYLFKLAKYQLFQGNAVAAKNLLDKGLLAYQQMQFESLWVGFEQLCAKELYCQMTGYPELFSARDKVDSFFRLLAQDEYDGGNFYQQVVLDRHLARPLAGSQEKLEFQRMSYLLKGKEKTTSTRSRLTDTKLKIYELIDHELESIFSGDSVVVLQKGPLNKNYETCLVECMSCDQEPRLVREELVRSVYSVLFSSGVADSQMLTKSLAAYETVRHEVFDLDKQLSCSVESTKNLVPSSCKPCLVSDHQYLPLSLPSSWLAVCLDIDLYTGCLVLTRHAPNKSPELLKLPLERHLSGRYASFKSAIEELEAIIHESDLTTKPEVTSRVKTRDDRAEWWSRRKRLDSRLKNLLQEIDSHWFGGFKGVFGNKLFASQDVEQFQQSLEYVLGKHTGRELKLSEFETDMFLQLDLASDAKRTDIEDLLQHLQISDDVSHDVLMFEIECELRKVKPVAQRDHLVLIVSSECIKMPWESIPFLASRSVSRMPSVEMLEKLLQNSGNKLATGISASNGYYVINPGGDLKRTEANFKELFTHRDGWTGVIGMRPSEEQLVSGLEGKMYIYAGHGGGEQIIRSKTIKNMDRLPPALLLGCSSGKLKTNGVFKPYGTVYNYLTGGCPMVVANLWDVTDKDIDKFTLRMFDKWGFTGTGSTDIGHSIAESRNVCVLPYLNGAAPVLYGLPFKLCNE